MFKKRKDGRRFPAFAEIVIRLGIQSFSRVMWRPEVINRGRFLNLEKPCFVYGNHSQNFDPFILNMFTHWNNSTAGVLTQEYFRGKIMNAGMRGISLIPTKKHVPEPHIIRQIFQQIKYERSFLIYPEGGRRWAGLPIPWIESSAKIFTKLGVPVYPIVTHGSYISWPRWAKYPRPAKLKLQVFDPLYFDKKTPLSEVVAKLKAPLDIDENIVPDELKPKWAYRPADGIHRLLYRDLESGKNGGIFTTDGTYVENSAGTIRYKMLPDSTLLDEKSGEVFTTGGLYTKITNMPIESDDQGVVIRETVDLREELSFPDLIPYGKAEITLYDDAVRIKAKDYNATLGLEKILYVGTERNSKAQLFLKDKMIQFNFLGAGSALQWQDTILRMKKRASDQSTSAHVSTSTT